MSLHAVCAGGRRSHMSSGAMTCRFGSPSRSTHGAPHTCRCSWGDLAPERGQGQQPRARRRQAPVSGFVEFDASCAARDTRIWSAVRVQTSDHAASRAASVLTDPLRVDRISESGPGNGDRAGCPWRRWCQLAGEDRVARPTHSPDTAALRRAGRRSGRRAPRLRPRVAEAPSSTRKASRARSCTPAFRGTWAERECHQ
jgi:hypothetical protein